MKKVISLAMVALLVLATFLVAGCSNNATTEETTAPATETTLKFGAGVSVEAPATTDATEDKDGTGKLDSTYAAVTVDAEGKIVACALDTASNTVKFTAEGKAVATEEFKTKYELGNDYNMVAYGGAVKEWFEQVDALEALVVGKTLDEVKALMTEENKGNDDVIAAGCTITIDAFIAAIENAYNAAAESNVTAADTLKVTASTEQTIADATEDKNGSSKVSTTYFAAAVDAEGKVVACASDCVEVTFTFDTKGASTLDTTKEIRSKKTKGTDYGMVAYGGATLEWNEQVAAFDALCIGKTAAEISALMAEDGKGVEDVQTAGCTIYVTGLVKAAAKIA